MNKLINWLKWIDNNLVHIAVLGFIVLSSLVPKIPLKHIEFTYIQVRIDDIFPIILGLIFAVQFIRRKVKLNTKFLVIFCLYWLAVFFSFLIGAEVKNTIVVEGIGYLHSMRRIEYMFVFFVASSAITSEKRFKQYMIVYFVTLALVSLYGIGQKFLAFPSIQSMNPAYADGRILTLNAYDRINSTFGGHFDLAGYLTFSLPIILGFYYALKQKRYFFLFALALVALLYTAMRSAFAAYLVSITLFLMLNKKFKMLVLVGVVTVVLTVLTGQMVKRFQQTFQVKTVFVNTQTGATNISQKNTVQELPGGGKPINIHIPLLPTPTAAPVQVDPAQIQQVAIQQATDELKRTGRTLNTAEINKRASEISKYIKPQRSVLCDISCSVRFEVEWPRAIGAFFYNPLIGTGPSSITEATDNDVLRSFGEVGLLGTALLAWILISICRYVLKAKAFVEGNERLIYSGFVLGVVALFLNAFYVDVFEASKVAYNFWMVAGFFVGVSSLIINAKNSNGKREQKKTTKN